MDASPGSSAGPASLRVGGAARLTLHCLLALAIGVAGGILATRFGWSGASTASSAAEVIIRLWTNAFRMLVAPLVATQLYLAVARGAASGRDLGRLGLAVPVVFVGLLTLTAVVTAALATGFLTLPIFDRLVVDPLPASLPVVAPTGSGAGWVDGFVPPNLLAAATTDNILPLMVFSLVFAVAARRVDPVGREALGRLAAGVSQACFVMVGWLLKVTPAVILAVGFRAALASGLGVGEAIVGFTVLESVILVLVVVLLYPVTTLLGGVRPVRLARALWPAQLAAMSTRSSLATLPALFTGAQSGLGIRPDTAGYVLPIAGATLKLSRAVSGPVKLLFLAHLLGISLGPTQIAVFIATIIVLSASTVGVPSVTSGNRSLPAYVAAGIPAEYVVLLGVAVTLTDVLLTLLNTTGYMSATALVDRWRSAPARDPEAAVGDAAPAGGTGMSP